MASTISFVVLLTFLIKLTALFSCGHMKSLFTQEVTHNYTLSIEPLQSIPPFPKVPKVVTNLYNVMQHFIGDNCLIVVNNFEGNDIYPTIQFPLMLRQFDLARGRVQRTFEFIVIVR